MKTIDIYITEVCNLNCEYCYVDIKKTEKSFDSSKFVSRINLLKYDHVKFFGGEPLLRWNDIQRLGLSLSKKNKKITIVTNGTLLDIPKVLFCVKYNINIVVSVHYNAVGKLLPKLSSFTFANHIIGFSFIFEIDKIKFPLKIVRWLHEKGFENFILTPDVYGSWTDRSIFSLEKELNQVLLLFTNNKSLNFSGPSRKELSKLIKGCKKDVYTKEGDKHICNRFDSVVFLKEKGIPGIYKEFNNVMSYDIDPDKWFYICPIGWYLDTLKQGSNIGMRIEQYKKINQVFLNFYRAIDTMLGEVNFLSKSICEVRFNITSQCNIRCDYCYVDFKNETIDIGVAKNIIDLLVLKNGDTKTISFFGGEPLLEFTKIKEIVLYAKKIFTLHKKTVAFNIATNFLLIDDKKNNFLIENDFKIHISLNGLKYHNDNMRDNSTELLLHKMDKYITSKEDIIILLAFSNYDISTLSKNILFIYGLGFREIHLEMIFGMDYDWSKSDFIHMKKEFLKIKGMKLSGVSFISKKKNSRTLDISVDGKCSDNSLEFHGYQSDFTKQKIFKKILISVFGN